MYGKRPRRDAQPFPTSFLALCLKESGLGLLLCASFLAGSASSLDFLAGALGELVRHNSQLLGKVAISKNLQRLIGLPDKSQLLKQGTVDDLSSRLKFVLKNIKVNHNVLKMVRVVETTLRQTPDQRNLATFKVRSAAMACSGSSTLLTATSGAPVARTVTTSNTLAIWTGYRIFQLM